MATILVYPSQWLPLKIKMFRIYNNTQIPVLFMWDKREGTLEYIIQKNSDSSFNFSSKVIFLRIFVYQSFNEIVHKLRKQVKVGRWYWKCQCAVCRFKEFRLKFQQGIDRWWIMDKILST